MIIRVNQRFFLQLAVAIAATVPVCAGILGMLMGTDMVGTMAANMGSNPSLDSHMRYLSGILFAMGIVFWSYIPRIEHKTRQIKLLTFLIFIGGLARLYAALFVATPSIYMQMAIIMELVITPVLCLWQIHVSKMTLQYC